MSIISPSNIADINLPNQLAATDRRLGPITYIASNELSFYKNNPRKHPEKQIVKLMASIREFGIARPILITTDNVIIDGAAVVEAARRLNIPQLPVIVADQWSEQQVQAYRVASNQLPQLAIWDKKSLAIELSSIIEFEEVPIEILGWEDDQLDMILDCEIADPVTDPTNVIHEATGPVVSRTGDLWQLGKHRLLCDSLLDPSAWIKLMDGNDAKMAFMSVPYNASAAGCTCGETKCDMAASAVSSIERQQVLTEAVAQISNSLADGAILAFCIEWTMIEESLRAFRLNGLPLVDMCVWNKNRDEIGSLYRAKHELVPIAKKGTGPHTNNIHLNKSRGHRTNVWDYAVSTMVGDGCDEDLSSNCAAKPIALVSRVICDFTLAREIVIDGFVGRGTTILAAERTSRLCYGMELDPSEVDIAIGRWEAMTGEPATLEGTGETYSEVSARRVNEYEDSQDS